MSLSNHRFIAWMTHAAGKCVSYQAFDSIIGKAIYSLNHIQFPAVLDNPTLSNNLFYCMWVFWRSWWRQSFQKIYCVMVRGNDEMSDGWWMMVFHVKRSRVISQELFLCSCCSKHSFSFTFLLGGRSASQPEPHSSLAEVTESEVFPSYLHQTTDTTYLVI